MSKKLDDNQLLLLKKLFNAEDITRMFYPSDNSIAIEFVCGARLYIDGEIEFSLEAGTDLGQSIIESLNE